MVLRLLMILLVLLGIHSGYQFASPAIKNSMLEGKMKDMVRNRGLRGERELRRDLLAYARENDIPLHEGNIYVEVTNHRVAMSAHYQRDVKVLFVSKHYEFSPASSPELKPRAQRRTR